MGKSAALEAAVSVCLGYWSGGTGLPAWEGGAGVSKRARAWGDGGGDGACVQGFTQYLQIDI